MESIKIADYMNHRPVTFKATMTVEQAVEKLLQSGQTGGPVIDASRRVIGFLSEQDCLKKMLESTYQNESHSVVSDVMRTEALSVYASESVLSIADKMLVDKPKLYPVIDDEGYLVGVITRADVLKAIDKHLHANYEAGSRYV